MCRSSSVVFVRIYNVQFLVYADKLKSSLRLGTHKTGIMVIMTGSSAGSQSSCAQARPLQVGFYEIIRTLGKGNFAVVKTGQTQSHENTGQTPAEYFELVVFKNIYIMNLCLLIFSLQIV